jgi:hypothetical protein
VEWFDYDAMTGVTEYFDHDEMTGKSYIRTEQDVQPLLDYNAALRNGGLKDKDPEKGGPMMRHYASVPMVVINELLTKGINFFDKNDFPRVIAEINKNYPYLKVTDKVHNENSAGVVFVPK